MANEIKLTLNLTCTNGDYSDTWRNVNSSFNQTTQGAAGGIATTSVSAANLNYGSISTANAGMLAMRNCDATNACDFGISVSSSFHAVGRILAGEECYFRVTPSTQIQLQAVAGTPNIQYWLLEA